jgi:S-adenosylmethionine-dependent methyltransferase
MNTMTGLSMRDKNFDELDQRFARNIYNAPKGEIRLRLVQEELLKQCPALLSGNALRILDAGCGLGHMASWLSGLGHQMVCCDLSSIMLERTRDRMTQENPAAMKGAGFFHAPVQELHCHVSGKFDLVIFHAVLEWMDDPQNGLRFVLPWVKPEGMLSLMFYNRHALIFKNLLRGHFRKIEQQSFRGEDGGLTPLNPLLPTDVEQWLLDAGCTVLAKQGIRTFYDYMDVNRQRKDKTGAGNDSTIDRNAPSLEEIIQMEKKYGNIEPYRSLGRYQLWHCRCASPLD